MGAHRPEHLPQVQVLLLLHRCQRAVLRGPVGVDLLHDESAGAGLLGDVDPGAHGGGAAGGDGGDEGGAPVVVGVAGGAAEFGGEAEVAVGDGGVGAVAEAPATDAPRVTLGGALVRRPLRQHTRHRNVRRPGIRTGGLLHQLIYGPVIRRVEPAPHHTVPVVDAHHAAHRGELSGVRLVQIRHIIAKAHGVLIDVPASVGVRVGNAGAEGGGEGDGVGGAVGGGWEGEIRVEPAVHLSR
mmetsp:Transcript_36339/g.79341  ORF Transcript_36339/g.79341 Transcript_36339/m.79341 type:complete len:240 (+) Transcript_36339:1398-2117(+)